MRHHLALRVVACAVFASSTAMYALAKKPANPGGKDRTAPAFAADAASGPNTFQTIASGEVTLSGTAADEVGVSSVTVNGASATLGGSPQQATWAADVPVQPGINRIEVSVTDAAGNQTTDWWAVFCAETYLPDADLVPDAAAIYVTDSGFAAFGQLASQFANSNNALAQALEQHIDQNLMGNVGLTVDVVRFGTPAVNLTPAANGLEGTVRVADLEITSNSGVTINAQAVTVEVEIDVSASGKYTANVPTANAIVAGLQVSANGPPAQAVDAALRDAAAGAVQQTLPQAIEQALSSFTPSYTQTIRNVDFTFVAEPTDIIYTADSVRIVLRANATHNQPGQGAPGSLGFASTPAPQFGQDHDVCAAISNETLNRALYAAWDSGLLNHRIDQGFLQQGNAGPGIPFGQVISALAAVMPRIGQLDPVPIGLEISYPLPPSIGLDNDAPVLRAAYEVALVMDFGNGPQSILSMEIFAEIAADVSVNASFISVEPGDATSVESRIAQNGNPLNLPVQSVSAFVNQHASSAVNLLGNFIPSIPLPAIPAFSGTPGVQLDSLDSTVDNSYVTVNATFR